jgi:hypothetical protein
MVTFEPPLGTEHIHVVPPGHLVPVDRVSRHAEDCALREVYAINCQTTFRSHTRKANRRGGVDPQGFVDDGIQVRKPFHLFKRSDSIT